MSIQNGEHHPKILAFLNLNNGQNIVLPWWAGKKWFINQRLVTFHQHDCVILGG